MDKPYNTTVRGQEDAEKAVEVLSQVIDSLKAHVDGAVGELVLQVSNVIDEAEAMDHPDKGAGMWISSARYDALHGAYVDAE